MHGTCRLDGREPQNERAQGDLDVDGGALTGGAEGLHEAEVFPVERGHAFNIVHVVVDHRIAIAEGGCQREHSYPVSSTASESSQARLSNAARAKPWPGSRDGASLQGDLGRRLRSASPLALLPGPG